MALTSPYKLSGDHMAVTDLVDSQQAPAPVTGGLDSFATTTMALPASGPMPTVPPGGLDPYPLAPPPPTGGYNPPLELPPQLQQLQLPGLSGQQYVAQAYGTNNQSPAIPSAAPWQGVPINTGGWNPVNPVQSGPGGMVEDPTQSGQRVQGFLNDLLNSGNPYLTNAARRGLETAGTRGLLNSSIAAGSSTRSAIEAAQPILNEIMGLNNAREGMRFTGGENAAQRQLQADMQAQGLNFEGQQNQLQRELTANLQQQGWGFEAAQAEAQRQLQAMLSREGLAFQGEQAQLNRTQDVNNMMLNSELGLRNMAASSFYNQQNAQQDFNFRRALQSDSVAQQDWLTNQNFSREFNAGLAMLPIQNASQLHNYMMQAALEQPEVFTPEILSGFSNFFNNQFLAQMQMYFPQTSGGTP